MANPNAPIANANRFKLGIFAPNCSGGLAVTRAPERWVNSWENNLKLAKVADEGGLEFLLPIARWIGYGGETNFHGSVLETTVWATGLLAVTKRINVFTTVHTAFNHPVVVAKQIATMDQIGKGRVGLNVVCGWNKPEYEALGGTLPDDHVTRYGMGEEWFNIIEKLWTHDGPFDWDGKYWQLHQTYGEPKPLFGRPPIFNAAGSVEGREFATRNADFLFTSCVDLERSREEVAGLKALAESKSRSVGVLTHSYAVCRPTKKEAEDWIHYYVDELADWGAVENIIGLMFAHAHSFPKDMLQLIRSRFAGGHGGFPLVGTPDDVAEGMRQLHDVGFSGTTLAMVNYAEELPYIIQEVFPRLERMGLRVPMK